MIAWLKANTGLHFFQLAISTVLLKEVLQLRWTQSLKKMKLPIVFLVFLAVHVCGGARILFMGVLGSVSHKRFYMPIAESLAERGHDITVVSSFAPVGKPVKNIREIVVDLSDLLESYDYFEIHNFRGLINIFAMHYIFGDVMVNIYDRLIQNQEFRQLQHNEKFDLVVVDGVFNEFSLPIADSFKVPIITVGPIIDIMVTNMGTPRHFASYPYIWTDHSDQMSYRQRLSNTISSILGQVAREYFIVNPLNSKIQKDFPQMRTIQEVEKDISLCIVNSNPAYNFIRPLPPTVIEVNGLHMKLPKPLPSV